MRKIINVSKVIIYVYVAATAAVGLAEIIGDTKIEITKLFKK